MLRFPGTLGHFNGDGKRVGPLGRLVGVGEIVDHLFESHGIRRRKLSGGQILANDGVAGRIDIDAEGRESILAFDFGEGVFNKLRMAVVAGGFSRLCIGGATTWQHDFVIFSESFRRGDGRRRHDRRAYNDPASSNSPTAAEHSALSKWPSRHAACKSTDPSAKAAHATANSSDPTNPTAKALTSSETTSPLVWTRHARW